MNSAKTGLSIIVKLFYPCKPLDQHQMAQKMPQNILKPIGNDSGCWIFCWIKPEPLDGVQDHLKILSSVENPFHHLIKCLERCQPSDCAISVGHHRLIWNGETGAIQCREKSASNHLIAQKEAACSCATIKTTRNCSHAPHEDPTLWGLWTVL